MRKGTIILGVAATGLIVLAAFFNSINGQSDTWGTLKQSIGSQLGENWQGNNSIPSCAGIWEPNFNDFANYHADGCYGNYGISIESQKELIPVNSRLITINVHFSNIVLSDGKVLVNIDHSQAWLWTDTKAYSQWANIKIDQTVKEKSVMLLYEQKSPCYGQVNNPCPTIDLIQWEYQ